MLNRQKALLYMIEKAKRPLTHLEVTKWAFLLAHEMPSKGGDAFYQFLPYKYGPFSFSLYHEISSLVFNGYLGDDRKAWSIVANSNSLTSSLPKPIKEDANRVVERFREKTPQFLTDYVYKHFPRFTVNSMVKRMNVRPITSVATFTVGYQGLLVDGFLNLLIRSGIQRIIDVRNNPVARRYGFHKKTLDRLSGKVEIEYIHFPELGIPSQWRQTLSSGDDYKVLFAKYEDIVLPAEQNVVKNVAELMSERPSALMCMEADPKQCHRSRLANAIANMTGMPVKHLGECDEDRL